MSAAGVKSANFNMRMDPQTKSSAESLFRELGMTLPQAVNMFIARALSVGGMPFDMKMPRYNRERLRRLCRRRLILAAAR